MGKRGADRKPHVQRGAGNEAALWMKEHSTTLREAAEHFGATHQTVHVAWRRLFGDEPMPTQLQRDGKLGAVSELVDKGMSAREISERLGVLDGSVREYCRHNNLQLTPAHRYAHHRDGRSLRAADLVRGGMSIRDACLAERVNPSVVRRTLKRQAGRKS